MSHIFKPGDKAYWYDPKWGVDRVIELIANNNEEKKSTFPLIGTYPITKPLSERMQVFFTKDGRILPSYPIVLFTDKPVKDENQMKFKHGDLVFYLPEKEWVSVLAYGGSPGKIYTQRSDVDFFDDDPSTLLEINEGGTLGGKQVLLKYNPFDKNDPNNPSSKPVKDENQMKFKSGDKAFYLPSKRWVDIISCDTHSVKDYYYTLREYDEDGKSLTIHTFNIQSDTNGFKDGTPIFLDHNPFDKNDPNNPSSCTNECKEEKDADYFLNKAVEILKERGKERDVEKERSMARIVSVYNALTGQSMSVEDGWKFMAILKLVRIQIKPHEDGFLDALSYIALWGEEFFNNETTKGD